MREAQDWDSCHGLKMRYVNPTTGDYALPTMAAYMQLLPNGMTTAPMAATITST